jgi:hypothetical protein
MVPVLSFAVAGVARADLSISWYSGSSTVSDNSTQLTDSDEVSGFGSLLSHDLNAMLGGLGTSDTTLNFDESTETIRAEFGISVANGEAADFAYSSIYTEFSPGTDASYYLSANIHPGSTGTTYSYLFLYDATLGQYLADATYVDMANVAFALLADHQYRFYSYNSISGPNASISGGYVNLSTTPFINPAPGAAVLALIGLPALAIIRKRMGG